MYETAYMDQMRYKHAGGDRDKILKIRTCTCMCVRKHTCTEREEILEGEGGSCGEAWLTNESYKTETAKKKAHNKC